MLGINQRSSFRRSALSYLQMTPMQEENQKVQQHSSTGLFASLPNTFLKA
jgi:hypothetical protein